MKFLDILILVVIGIIVVMLAVENINSTIRNKLTDISVNIPPISIPDPNIIIKIHKKCMRDEMSDASSVSGISGASFASDNSDISEYTIYVEKGIPVKHSITPLVSGIEKFDSTGRISHSIQSMPNNLKNSVTEKSALPDAVIAGQLNNNIDDAKKTAIVQTTDQLKIPINSTILTEKPVPSAVVDLETNVKFPDPDNVVAYGNYTCVKNIINPTPISANMPKSHIYNQSIQNARNDAIGQMMYNKKYGSPQNVRHSYDSSGKFDTSNQSDFIDDSDEWDPNEYYKQFQVHVDTYLEDPKTRGANVGNFDKYATLSDIGKINLTTTNPYPKGTGYIFSGSSAYAR